MNQRSNREILLAEVLAEAEPTAFRAELFAETLLLAGRRRRMRRVRHISSILVVVGFLGMFAWRLKPIGPAVVTPPAANYATIHTEPLPTDAIVRTVPFSAGQNMISVASVEEISTRPDSGSFRYVDDVELLALVSPRSAALVRVGPHTEKLVFVDPADQEGLN